MSPLTNPGRFKVASRVVSPTSRVFSAARNALLHR